MKVIKIAVADDQQLFRQCLVSNINQLPTIQVSIEAENGHQLLLAINAAAELPDVVLLDLDMPGMNGVETTAKIQAGFPALKVIILSVHCEARHIIYMIEKGINGYLSKSSTLEEVNKAITAVYNNGFYFAEEVMRTMQQGLQTKGKKFYIDIPGSLTRREKEVLGLICKEYTTPEIATALFLSERTVEGHRNNLLLKTGARNTAGLVIFALRHQLMDPTL
ncbi:response regulator transcription factor [Pseudoflavitalea sp. X16]|uniref:response regulator transcription factor n=1 Tax=Paraflavitalea devenefica TaxID=2716334 RepID=UPI0014244B79|nr:response regulator transcription factor [Paraflavitalea devenefica]NII27006.1 response regulator transcription factor [Paraflavitalea devenefica]